ANATSADGPNAARWPSGVKIVVGFSSRQTSDSMARVCFWALGYALRRKIPLFAALAAMVLEIGLEVLKPWPLKILVDHGLNHQSTPAWLARALEWLPGGGAPQGLIGWCVVATVALFLLGWSLGLAAAYANISLGQRMVYDLAGDLFGHLQRLSLRFHS